MKIRKPKTPKIESQRPEFSAIIDREYDLVIIGGGITGANVLWDATLRGLNALLVERNDYASGTSQATSKLIHGGLRYLQNAEFGLVRESLRERRTLGVITPHAVAPLAFVIPIYKWFDRLLLRAGMILYDLLSYDKNRDVSDDCLIPGYTYWGKKRTIAEASNINSKGLLGAYVYYDYANLNPERHTTEFIFSAREKGGTSRNYTSVTALARTESGYQVTLEDRITGKQGKVSAKAVINAAGPWADLLEQKLKADGGTHLVRSKGIHLIVRKIISDKTLVLRKKDGTHLFVIPWRNRTIIGTTDTVYKDDPDSLRVTPADAEDLLSEINYALGLPELTLDDIEYFYCGLRPLVEDPGNENSSSTYNASRKTEILDHEKNGYPGFYTALGGKYTTSRALAQEVVDQVISFLQFSSDPCRTKITPLKGGEFENLRELYHTLRDEFPKKEEIKAYYFASRYGSDARRFLQRKVRESKSWVLSNGEPFFEEELLEIVEKEDVVKATDFFFRRSGVGNVGMPEEEVFEEIFSYLTRLMGWNPPKARREKQEVRNRYNIHSKSNGNPRE